MDRARGRLIAAALPAAGTDRPAAEDFGPVAAVWLLGIVKKNGIMMIDFAIQRMAEGIGPEQAVREASLERFRPIIMTSLAFVLGVLPLAVSTGAGSASRHSIGTGVIGGMLAATFVAILFVPVFFRLVTRARPVTDTKRTDVVQAPAK